MSCGRLAWLTLGVLVVCGSSALAGAQPSFAVTEMESPLADTTPALLAAQNQAPDHPWVATIKGKVVDATGSVLVGAHVKLSRENQSLDPAAISDSDGQFSFAGIAPGSFQLTISADGFATQTYSGMLLSGEDYSVPPIALVVAAASTQVHVSLSTIELAEAEIKDEEKQRVLGIIPNFYVTYDPAAVPLRPKQKFELAWKATVDPVSFGVTAAVAGIEQAANSFGGYGQGVQGYAKRYGASYGDLVTSTFLGGAILPSLLKQDPRYFYKGSGTTRSRILYAIANTVICKGDNRRWQPNYSAILGGIASGAISNLYYPAADRSGAALTFENALIGIGSAAATNILQEFVIRRLTPHPPSYSPSKP